MFKQARIKLTVWYLLIIMIVSVFFSVGIYQVITSELNRVERMHRLQLEDRLPNPLPPERFRLDPDLIKETETRLKLFLILINLIILTGSAAAAYFLSGKTLQSIKVMVDEQSRFITDSSHELRTPLTALKSEIEVNLRDKQLNLIGAKKLLLSNLEEVNNLQVLSDNLIKLTQYQKGRNDLIISKISLASIVAPALKKANVSAKNKKIIVINKTKNLNLKGNQSTLVEMLTIFLDNAIKYSPAKSKVTITSLATDGHVLITISDQGIGISQKDIPHLFDRFFRADQSRSKTNISGYGLGLAIAKQIIERHHGSIKVHSRLREGTTFTIKLPISA
ncbi:MAG: HAMP domain-containing sensor histidine kinase [Candidatus Beckwithbacteria bacterium]|nr:HAMP domain-containing sensor histidine kinase [Candidatus Beckwithbacteria bacterium]